MVQTSASPSSPQSSSFCSLPSPFRKCPSLPSVSLFIWTFLSPCLPALSTQATAQLRPSYGPHHRWTCPNVSADIKALYGLLPLHLLHVRLHFLTQLMLLRSWRMPSLQSACHKFKANSNDMLPSQPVPAVPLPPRRPPKHHYCFIQVHITVQCPGQCKEHGTFNNLLC